MPDFLTQGLIGEEGADAAQVLLRLVAAMLLGGAVAWIYRRTRGDAEVTRTFVTTLVLLSILIAMVTQVIGDNVARAFSLVGALSIVRFRTVVRDTQDTAFVIFAVVIGMAAGANRPWVALIGLIITGFAAYVMNRKRRAGVTESQSFLLSLRVGLGSDVDSLLGSVFDKYLLSQRLMSIATARQGVSLNRSYETRLRDGSTPDELVKALNRIEGVQGVELQRRSADEE